MKSRVILLEAIRFQLISNLKKIVKTLKSTILINLIKSILIKDKMFYPAKKHLNNLDFYEKYKLHKNILICSIKLSKPSLYHRILNENKRNAKKVLDVVYELISNQIQSRFIRMSRTSTLG